MDIVLLATRILLNLTFAMLGIYLVISACIDVFLLTGTLRAGARMYMDLMAPSYGQLAEFQFVAAIVMWLLAVARSRLTGRSILQ